MEDAIVAVGAYGEGLGVVLEGVGWWFGALVDDGEFAPLLEEIEGCVGADAMDAARSYVAGDTEVAASMVRIWLSTLSSRRSRSRPGERSASATGRERVTRSRKI